MDFIGFGVVRFWAMGVLALLAAVVVVGVAIPGETSWYCCTGVDPSTRDGALPVDLSAVGVSARTLATGDESRLRNSLVGLMKLRCSDESRFGSMDLRLRCPPRGTMEVSMA